MLDKRLEAILLPSGGLTVALDHGLGGVPRGFERVSEVIEAVLASGPDGVIVTPGIARAWGERFAESGIGMIGAVDAAISEGPAVVGHAEVAKGAAFADLGCIATKVVFQLGWSGAVYCQEISRIAAVIEDSHSAGLPCMVEPTVIGGEGQLTNQDRSRVLDGCRIASELGADVLKMPMLSADGVRAAKDTSHCPVTIMGGAEADVATFLAEVRASLEGGALGVVVGRNVWQGGATVTMVEALRKELALALSVTADQH